MRALPLAVALVLLVPAGAQAFAPVFVTLDLETGKVFIDPWARLEPILRLADYKAMGDACSSAAPVVTECTGVASPHAAIEQPSAGWAQAILYPREIVSVEGGTFEIEIAWESASVGLLCHVPPTANDPGALLGITCEDFGPFANYDWRNEPWTMHGRQSEGVVGAIQYTVLFAQ